MSFYNSSALQGPRGNLGITPRQSVQNTSYGNRMQPTFSNNRLHPSQSNQQRSVYGRQSMAPNVQSVGSSQYLQSSPNSGLQGRQPQYGRSQVGRSSAVQSYQPSSQEQPQFSGGPDGVKYIPLNWEDILGGKDGMKGLQVSMAPAEAGNPNRQLKFSFGTSGHGDAPAVPGEVPLKVVSFQPVADYPGKGGQPITMTPQQMMLPAAPSAKSSGYQPQRPYQMPQKQHQPQPLRSTAIMSPGPNNSMPGQPQMIMMPPVYYTPGNGITNGPPGMQGQNSCKGCPNCKGNANSIQNNRRY